MNYDQYYPLALRTAPPFRDSPEDLRHCMYGLTTEIGEFVGEAKRLEFYCVGFDDAIQAAMQKELGDTLWYTAVGLRGLHAWGVALPQPSPQPTSNTEKLITSLDGAVTMLTMLGGAFAVEYHSMRYFVQPNTEQMSRALKAIIYAIDKTALLLGTTGDQLRADNIAKLRLRYPEGFSGEAAEARADVGGLGHRES